MGYEQIDHTADLGIRITAASIKDLFRQAASAVLKTMNACAEHGDKDLTIKINGIDREDTLVRWLQEIIYRVTVENLRVSHIEITVLEDTRAEATIKGIYKASKLSVGIKAATYHNLKIEKTKAGTYEATIIFDV
jgi:SHS2 domain-containing protein